MNSNQREYLTSIERSGRSLVAIVDDILDYSKFEQGHLELETIPVDLVELVDDVMLGVQHRCHDKRVDLKTEYLSSTAEVVSGDPTRIRQVLTNLVGNAIKFTSEGSVTLRIWQEMDTVYFAVRDTGIGIVESEIPKLFERFQQADRSITREYGGTGLGLAICRLLVEAMGGSVEVQSTLGQGSEFKVSMQLPVVDQGQSEKVEQLLLTGNREAIATAELFLERWPINVVLQADDQLSNRQSLFEQPFNCSWPLRLVHLRQAVCGKHEVEVTDVATLTPLNGLSVLVAEDNPVNQLVIKKHLQNLGALVTLVADGELAVEAVKGMHNHDKFDVVLMDCEMPKMDGYTATRTLRKQSSLEIPIIALTAHAGTEYKKQALDAGMDDYLTKPISKTDLVRTVLSHV